jgi:hypothetical protein
MLLGSMNRVIAHHTSDLLISSPTPGQITVLIYRSKQPMQLNFAGFPID